MGKALQTLKLKNVRDLLKQSCPVTIRDCTTLQNFVSYLSRIKQPDAKQTGFRKATYRRYGYQHVSMGTELAVGQSVDQLLLGC